MLIEKGKMNNIFLIKFENSDYSDEGNLRRWILFKALKLPICTMKGICIHSNVSISEQLLFLHIINCVQISYFLILSAQIIGERVQKNRLVHASNGTLTYHN